MKKINKLISSLIGIIIVTVIGLEEIAPSLLLRRSINEYSSSVTGIHALCSGARFSILSNKGSIKNLQIFLSEEDKINENPLISTKEITFLADTGAIRDGIANIHSASVTGMILRLEINPKGETSLNEIKNRIANNINNQTISKKKAFKEQEKQSISKIKVKIEEITIYDPELEAQITMPYLKNFISFNKKFASMKVLKVGGNNGISIGNTIDSILDAIYKHKMSDAIQGYITKNNKKIEKQKESNTEHNHQEVTI